MQIKKASLADAMANLEQALAQGVEESPRLWASRVDQALADVQRAVQRQDAIVELPSGGIVDVDSAQEPSPGLDRAMERLHEDLACLLAEAGALRSRLRQLMEGSSREMPASSVFDALRQHAAVLLDDLATYEQEEARLILETATTDIGAGD